MPFLICVKCPNSCSIDTHDKAIRPALCGPFPDGSMIAADWLEPAQHRILIEQFTDPMGAPYKPDKYQQSPIMDPVRPVMEASPRTAKQLLHEKEAKTKFRLRDQK